MKKGFAYLSASFLCASSVCLFPQTKLLSQNILSSSTASASELSTQSVQTQEGFESGSSSIHKTFTISRTLLPRSTKYQKSLRKIHPTQKPATRNLKARRSLSIPQTSPLNINGTITSLTSVTDSVISYRQQRHFWETSDGGLHILINRGGTGQNNGLVLYSSLDQGQTWTVSLTLANTGLPSNAIVIPSADGFLKNDKLLLSFINTTGSVKFLVANYDAVTQQWSNAFSSTISSSPQTSIGSNPTLLADANGVFWCAFVSMNNNTRLYSIRLFRSSDQGQNWTDTGIILSTESPSKAKSARLLALRDRMGVVYTTDKNFYWAYRLNNDAPNADWQQQLIFQATGAEEQDPFGSHFSAVTDARFNIHLATVSNKNLVYLKYKAQSQTWNIPATLTSFSGVAYPQAISSADNKLFIAFNTGIDGVSVIQSLDAGTTFTNAYYLTKPDISEIGGTANFGYPRMLAPASILSSTRLPMFRQFSLDNVQRLSYYTINASQ